MKKQTLPGVFAVAVATLLVAGLAAIETASAAPRPTVGKIMQEGKVLNPGRYRLAKRRMRCGAAKTLISPIFWDYGGAIPGYIIMNPKKISTLPSYVRMFVYYHECGHQYFGRDETRSDCFAVKRGRDQGWLNRRRVRSVCDILFKNSKGDRYHPPGPQRCRKLASCFEGEVVQERTSPASRSLLTIEANEAAR